jgi:hypothetical protein
MRCYTKPSLYQRSLSNSTCLMRAAFDAPNGKRLPVIASVPDSTRI